MPIRFFPTISAQTVPVLVAVQVAALDAGRVGPLLENPGLQPLVSDTGDTLFAGRGRASVYDLDRNRSMGDETLFSGMRVDQGRLRPFSMTVSQSAYGPNKGLSYSWENALKHSRTPHLRIQSAPEKDSLLAAGGPFLTSATPRRPFYACSIVRLARRTFPPNVDSGFWTRQGERVVCFGAKRRSNSSADFFLARKPSDASERWSLVRFSVKDGQGAVMSSLGTFQGRDLNVIGWSPYTGRFVAFSLGGATEYTQSGRALVSYRGAFVRAAYTPHGLLLTGRNPVSAYPADRTCLARGGTLTDIRKGKLFAASASGQYLVFKESDVYKLFCVPS